MDPRCIPPSQGSLVDHRSCNQQDNFLLHQSMILVTRGRRDSCRKILQAGDQRLTLFDPRHGDVQVLEYELQDDEAIRSSTRNKSSLLGLFDPIDTLPESFASTSHHHFHIVIESKPRQCTDREKFFTCVCYAWCNIQAHDCPPCCPPSLALDSACRDAVYSVCWSHVDALDTCETWR
jgi:hypothetical protein